MSENDKDRSVLNQIAQDVRGIKATLEHHHGLLHELKEQGINLMATQAELATALDAVNDKLAKIGTETASLIQMIADLKTQLADAPVSPELQAAFDRVAKQAQLVDDLVPDAK